MGIIDYNESAYPCGGYDSGYAPRSGMTLLDYFAAQVVGGIYSKLGMGVYPDKAADVAYSIAAHMLEERQKYLGVTK